MSQINQLNQINSTFTDEQYSWLVAETKRRAINGRGAMQTILRMCVDIVRELGIDDLLKALQDKQQAVQQLYSTQNGVELVHDEDRALESESGIHPSGNDKSSITYI